MLPTYTEDYLLDQKVKIFQPTAGYRASADAVLLSSMVNVSRMQSKILDVGSGTGAVSLCLAYREQKNDILMAGLELQPELAALSNYSAEQNRFAFLRYYQADIREKIDQNICKPCSFDIVVTNPPYSDHDMPSPNISKSTAHNLQAFNLKQWLTFCIKMAKPFGTIYMINRTEALDEICYTAENKCGAIKILPVFSKQGQPAKRIIVSMQKDSKAPLCILPPLTIHKPDGSYTDEAQKILRQGKTVAEIFGSFK